MPVDFDPARPVPDVGRILVSDLAALYDPLLDPSLDLTGPTRCPEWEARHVLIHLADAAEYATSLIAGGDAISGFDPNTTPDLLIAVHEHDAPDAVRGRLREAVAALDDGVRAMQAEGANRQVPSLWGVPYDWRGFVTHVFWDAWVHRRDVLGVGATGCSPDGDDLALAYGLYLCVVPSVLTDAGLDANVEVDPGRRARVRASAAEHRVTVEAMPGASGPELGTVVDSLAGRGALPSVVVGGPVGEATEPFAVMLRG